MPDVDATYALAPVHGAPDADPALAEQIAAVCQAIGLTLPPEAPPVVGWQLTLCAEGRAIASRTFDGGERGFDHAQHDGAAWLAQHGQDSVSQWLAAAAQSSQRMAWDAAYQRAIRRRGF